MPPIPRPGAAKPWSPRKWPTATKASRYEANPIERIRDLIEANRNYFPELEQAAENLRDEINVASQDLFAALGARLREKHSIVTRIMPVDVMRETLRRFDRHRRQL